MAEASNRPFLSPSCPFLLPRRPSRLLKTLYKPVDDGSTLANRVAGLDSGALEHENAVTSVQDRPGRMGERRVQKNGYAERRTHLRVRGGELRV